MPAGTIPFPLFCELLGRGETMTVFRVFFADGRVFVRDGKTAFAHDAAFAFARLIGGFVRREMVA